MLQKRWFKWAVGWAFAGATMVWVGSQVVRQTKLTGLPPGGLEQAWAEGFGFSIPIIVVAGLGGCLIGEFAAWFQRRFLSSK